MEKKAKITSFSPSLGESPEIAYITKHFQDKLHTPWELKHCLECWKIRRECEGAMLKSWIQCKLSDWKARKAEAERGDLADCHYAAQSNERSEESPQAVESSREWESSRY
ncbi:MAG: hypothetical protein RLZ12_960 [Bacillota bacterium]|jgi:hypothetical protein